MEKKFKVLVVEDDKKFAETLHRVFTEEGYECFIAEKPQTALSLIKVHTFDVALIDCMLPQMNGIDLALKIKEVAGDSLQLYLMSGIYKDKNFSVNAIKKTGAHSFLIKPFNLSDLVQMVNDSFKEVTRELSLKSKSVKGLFLQENLSQNLILGIIGYNPIINGNELPFILNALITYKCTGSLRIGTPQNQIELHLHNFQISVDSAKMPPGRFKSAIMNKGWVLQEDIDTLHPSDLGALRLLQLNMISPHACMQIEKENTLQTLAQFFVNDNINIKYSPMRMDPRRIVFEHSEIESQLYNWTMNSDIHWLKAFYLPHMNSQIRKMNLSQNKTQFFPVVAANKNVLPILMKNISVTDYFNESKIDDVTATQLLHTMLVFREFYLGDTQLEINYQLLRLKIWD